MRWALIRVCLAVTLMVVIAFAVPLSLVVKEMARDRAFTNAERQAASMGAVLAVTTDRHALEKALATTELGARGRGALHVPDGPGGPEVPGGPEAMDGSDGKPATVGTGRAPQSAVDSARRLATSVTAAVPGGSVLLHPVLLASGRFAVVEAFVPEAEVSRGVTKAWTVLAAVGLGLVIGAVAVADRLGARLVRPARRLADAAQTLGDGRLDARVPEEGPPELRSASSAFNTMAEQIARLLDSERELAADLSHRLRTPLTVLRLNAASLGDGPAAEQTRAAVEQLEGEVDQVIRTAREGSLRARSPGAGEDCDLAEVISDRMAFWAALAEDQGRDVRLAGVDRPLSVPVSRADLAAALDALLGNVFRHTPAGTAFAVDVHRADAAAVVLVSDAGEGIADPEAALTRGTAGERRGSTGLGLDIARQLAESTGGDVRISRSVLGGAEIRLWLALTRQGGRVGRRGARSRRGLLRLRGRRRTPRPVNGPSRP